MDNQINPLTKKRSFNNILLTITLISLLLTAFFIYQNQLLQKQLNQVINAQAVSSTSPEGSFCGGIAGTPCPSGYRCALNGKYPDAGGKCQR